MMINPSPDTARYTQSEKRISHCTIIFGALAALLAGYVYGWIWGGGIFIGALLAWLNFRWLRKGLDALTKAAGAQASLQKARVPIGAYMKAALRYGLIGLAVYVIFRFLHVPLLSIILGLCALGAATLAVSVHEILHSSD